MIVDSLRRSWARVLKPRLLVARRSVGVLSICFDDFPKTAWTEGGPVLRDHGVHATYYVCGGLCGGVFDGQRMYDAEDLAPIVAAGHELGCHTFGHPSCLQLDPASFEREAMQNQRFVSERIGDVRLVSFAYPYGDATYSTKRAAVSLFSSARGVYGGLNEGRLDLGLLRAIGFEPKRRGQIDRYIERAAARRAWLVVYTHEVQNRPGRYGCRPNDLDALLRSAKAAGLQVLPIKAALATRAFGHTPVTT